LGEKYDINRLNKSLREWGLKRNNKIPFYEKNNSFEISKTSSSDL